MENINELLIAAVEKRKALYDKTEDNYSNRVFIFKQWTEIGNELGIDGNTARKKWTTLRDYFYKATKQLKIVQSGAAADKRRKWYLYDSMKFLLPHITERKMTSNLSDFYYIKEDASQLSEASHESLPSAPLETLEHFEIHPERVSTPTSQLVASPSTSSVSEVDHQTAVNLTSTACATPHINTRPTTSKKRARYPQERGQNACLDGQILDAIVSMKTRTEDKKDDCDLFLQSLAPQLRSLNPLARYRCQSEIQILILRHLEQSQAPMTPIQHQ